MSQGMNKEIKKDSENFSYKYKPLEKTNQYSCNVDCLCVIPDERTTYDKVLQMKFGQPAPVKTYGVHKNCNSCKQ